MPSFSIPLSGLQADSTALNTIANNLSNMNTTGYKSQTTTFSDLFYQTLGVSGSGNEMQVGAGTTVASTKTNFTNGSISSTGNSTDMAISGNGFFVVQQNGVQELTRDGSFSLDSTGNLITASGQSVMGYPATNGVVNTSAALTGIQIPVGQVEQPNATTTFTINANLNSGATAGTTFVSPVVVYDTLGESHTLNVTYTKVSGSNSWTYNVDLGGDATVGGAGATGTLTFDGAGKLTSPTTDQAITLTSFTDKANDMTVSWDLIGSTGANISGVGSTSTNSSTSQDGYASGQYSSFTVDSSGNVVVSYSNNQKKIVGQVALATVANEQGLVRVGSNSYTTSLSSGDAVVGLAGVGGRGTISASSLEGSNVDTSTEFANLIVAQRAFQANSKAVTAFDTVTQTVIDMIR